jgi:hypothetical protein
MLIHSSVVHAVDLHLSILINDSTSLNAIFRAGTDIVSKAARDRVGHYLQALKQHFSGKDNFCLQDI